MTVLASSTELTLPAAAEYAKNYMAMERVHGVGVTLGVGTLEIGPAAEPEPEAGAEAPGRQRPAVGRGAPAVAREGSPRPLALATGNAPALHSLKLLSVT